MRKLLFLLAFTATTLFAQTDPTPQPRVPFPDDYTPSPCAAENVCKSFERYKFIAAGKTFLGLTMEDQWVTEHWDELTEAMKPSCAKMASCYATFDVTFMFCNDAVVPEMRTICNRFPEKSADRGQCQMFVETYALGIDSNSGDRWREAQKCAAEKAPFQPQSKPPTVWMVPEKFSPDYRGTITVYALNPDTHLPVQSLVEIEKTTLFTSGTPIGRPTTYYPFKWPVKLVRVPNAQGHTDVTGPMVTVAAKGYPPVNFRMPVEVSAMQIDMQPALNKLKTGKKNNVTFAVHDAKTGQPIEVRIMLGDQVVGSSNKPVALQWKRGKRPEIWATSLFHMYNDTVIAPAER
jgi:hypothetical protein